MEPTDLTHLTWSKSSYSGTQENCVEVARTARLAVVRDSKNPGGGVLVFGAQAFGLFLQDVRARDEDTHA
ncbi:DUF397 domain-containing protein [Saccharopolyspora sp. NPDC047091]|uniref:DUF397 domain-containing protein n=1 Tax=Saccharopolyspora sp. NPDC047091 TaxID=3155924 RepID=UPI0033C96D89